MKKHGFSLGKLRPRVFLKEKFERKQIRIESRGFIEGRCEMEAAHKYKQRHKTQMILKDIRSIVNISGMTIREISDIVGAKPYVVRYLMMKHDIPFKKRESKGSGPHRKTDYDIFMNIINSLYGFKFPVENQRSFLDDIKKHTGEYGIQLSNADICKILNISEKTRESWSLNPDSKSYRVMDERYQRLLVYEIRFRIGRLRTAKKMRERYKDE